LLHSLRFRLPLLFLGGIVAAGTVAVVIAVGLFQDYVRDRSLAELRTQATGIAKLYGEQAIEASDAEEGEDVTFVTATQIERATGGRLFSMGVDPALGDALGFFDQKRKLHNDTVNWQQNRITAFEFVPPGEDRTFLGVAHQLSLEGTVFGALVIAEPKAELESRFLTLIRRLGIAFLAGLLVAGGFAWYLSRRITGPVVSLMQAADEVARGRYDVRLPSGRGRDEIGRLARRFGQMASRLREANELERNFLMTVSHELRTPLTAIWGHVAALREGIADDPEAREQSLEAIAAEAVRLERLVQDVLDLAKLEAHRFTVRREEVDMERLVAQAYSGFDQEARRRGIDYDRRVASAATIVSDGDRVLQIVTNLLSNAFRWTPDGGRIELALAAENGSVSVSVADSGPGIEPEERDRIFRPFWSRDGRGTGLGLAISRELALALGGRIMLESTPGSGSRFELLLPSRPA